jgi:RNA polymerase sigma factor (sigma-70 family)
MGTVAPAAPSAGDQFRAARAGDQDAWTALVLRHSHLIWSIARSFRLDRAAAEDVVQTVWLVRDPEAVTSWLATTARRECLERLRRRVETVSDEELPDPVDDRRPEQVSLEVDRDRVLWNALQRLSERDRQLLRVLAATPRYADVAAALDMPVGSIGPTRARALRRLREELARAGIECLADVL